jgi:hypothetical protein
MASGHNKEFLKDPRAYLGGITVVSVGTQFHPSIDGFKTQVPKPLVYMDLVVTDSGVKSKNKQARADFSLQGRGGDSDIPAAWIPYVPEGTVNADVSTLPAVELPASGNPVFAFTGAMNGCSLVLATKDGKNWGIHVPNSKQAPLGFPVLKTAGYSYVKSIDFYQLDQLRQGKYGTKTGESRDAPGGGWYNTFAFFWFDKGGWTIVAQPQIMTAQGMDVASASSTSMSIVGKTNGAIVQV